MGDWFDSEQLRTAASASLALLALGALVVWRLVNRLVLRVALLALLALVAAGVWASRVELGQCADHCRCRLLGAEIEVPTCRDRGTLRPGPERAPRAEPR